MLDGLLSRGFSFKCKSLIKANRARIEVVRKRAEAKQRFLKEDLAKLLINGLDINAYGRTEEYLAGMNLLSCYDFIEQSCEYIIKQLSRMQKQGECPEECREAVASLMFAAARFSDLPELRELRDEFQQKYGSCLEAFVSRKFVERLSPKPPASEVKLQVLKEIASEFSIKWDSRGFEQRMAPPPVLGKVDIQNVDIIARTLGVLDGKNSIQNLGGNTSKREKSHHAGRQEIIDYREKSLLKRPEISSQGDHDSLSRGRFTQNGNKHSYPVEKGATEFKAERSSSSTHGKILDDVHTGYTRQSNGTHSPRKIEHEEASFCDKAEFTANGPEHRGKSESAIFPYDYTNQINTLNPKRKEPAEAPDWLKSSSNHALPPPYVKSNDNNSVPPYSKAKENKHRANSVPNHAASHVDGRFGEHLSCKSNAVNSSGRHPNSIEPDHHNHEHIVASQNDKLNSTKGQVEGPDSLKSRPISALPPPYVKSKDSTALPPYIKPKEDKHTAGKLSKHGGSDADGHFTSSSSWKSHSVNSSGMDIHERSYSGNEEQFAGPAKVGIFDHEKELAHQSEKIYLPKPRSSRRKHHKSSLGYDIEGSIGDDGTEKRSSSSRRKDQSRKGLQTMFDEEHRGKDDEERMIDKLLIHYSSKTSNYDPGKLRKKSRGHPSNTDAGESSVDQSRDAYNGKCEVVPHPTRSISLPHDQTASLESKRLLTRVNTFQPDNHAPHVHPKLPDYDDLAARFAALKGR